MKLARIMMALMAGVLLLTGLACSSGAATYQLTTVIDGQGTVSPTSGTFASGSAVTLTASAAAGWSFSHWGGGGNGSDTVMVVTMDSDKTVYAYFSNGGEDEPEVTPVPGYGALMIQSTPGDADVYIDGVDTGNNTPYVGTHISVGNHSLRLVYPHYKWRTEEITISGGETVYLNWSLELAPTVEAVLQPDGNDGKDASVYKWEQTKNYGDNSSLSVGGNVVGAFYRAFLEFNLSSIPPTAVITDAKLGLYYNWAYSTTTEGRLALYCVQQTWNEDEINWGNQPYSCPVAWFITSVPGYATDDFLYFDVGIANMQRWINGSYKYDGLMVRDYDEADAEGLRSFVSSDSAHAANRPKLVIQYYDPVGWVPLTFAQTHPEEAAYIAVHDEIQNAVLAYIADHNGELPVLNAHRSVDECPECHILDIGALLTSNGGLMTDVPVGCYGITTTSGVNDNCDGGFGITDCSAKYHYMWLLDSEGIVYSRCEGEGCASHSQDGYQGVWP